MSPNSKKRSVANAVTPGPSSSKKRALSNHHGDGSTMVATNSYNHVTVPTATTSSRQLGGGGTGEVKQSKGLRHFSMKVCRKVEEKVHTTYNEVADELVKEVIAERKAAAALNNTASGEKKEAKVGKYDEKNIRRRVYDALNVLMAMDIITKEKKEISWRGLPSVDFMSSSSSNDNNASTATAASGAADTSTGESVTATTASTTRQPSPSVSTSINTADIHKLNREIQYRDQVIKQKRESLRELIIQQVCFRNLMNHNMKRDEEQQQQQQQQEHNENNNNMSITDDDVNNENKTKNTSSSLSTSGDEKESAATSTATQTTTTTTTTKIADAQTQQPEKADEDNITTSAAEEKIPIPFIVVNTHSSAVIQCEMSPDRTDVMFDFSMPFEINDDNAILKRLGMDKATLPSLGTMLPNDLIKYCQDHKLLDNVLISEEDVENDKLKKEQEEILGPTNLLPTPPSPSSSSSSHVSNNNITASGNDDGTIKTTTTSLTTTANHSLQPNQGVTTTAS